MLATHCYLYSEYFAPSGKIALNINGITHDCKWCTSFLRI